MREFLFPKGDAWLLADSEEIGVADLGDDCLALLLFSDEDLATTYVEKSGLAGKAAKAVVVDRQFLADLRRLQGAGVTHVVIDQTVGRSAPTASITKVIEDAERQVG
ncbi:MAG TPA: hypothetical protein VF526_15365 [Solirubrobacteraceae bacterium]|jgi:hypothetical protein